MPLDAALKSKIMTFQENEITEYHQTPFHRDGGALPEYRRPQLRHWLPDPRALWGEGLRRALLAWVNLN